MKRQYWFGSLSNAALLERLGEVTSRDNATTAEMLAMLAEVERRKLHRPAGYHSLFRYCVGVLHMSGDMAYKRIQVARAARRFPQLLDLIADGRLHLTGARLLAPHLTRTNAEELLAAAVHRTTTEILVLLAERFPQADAPTRIVPAPPPSPVVATAMSPAASADAPTTGITAAPPAEPLAEGATELVLRPVVLSNPPEPPQSMEPLCPHTKFMPLSPGRYALQTTIDEQCHDLLLYVQALAGPGAPAREVPEAIKRGLELLAVELERQKLGAGTGQSRGSDDPRCIPVSVRREVWERDGGQCAFVGEGNHRCECRSGLQFDHVDAVGKGGNGWTADKVRLLCGPHNQLEAERLYGDGFMREKRDAARVRKQARLAGRAAVPDGDAATAAAVRSARARGLSPAGVLGSRAAAAAAQARLDALLAEPPRRVESTG